jgi:hypothetical protein
MPELKNHMQWKYINNNKQKQYTFLHFFPSQLLDTCTKTVIMLHTQTEFCNHMSKFHNNQWMITQVRAREPKIQQQQRQRQYYNIIQPHKFLRSY